MNIFILYSRPVRSIQFLILHIKYNTYLYFSIICINNFYKKIVTFGHEAFKVLNINYYFKIKCIIFHV